MAAMGTALRPVPSCAVCSQVTALALTAALFFKTFKWT